MAWETRNIYYEGLSFRPIVGATSYYRVLNDVIKSSMSPVLVVHDDTWFSIDARSHIDALMANLEDNFSNWGLCGNAGVRWDGILSSRHVSDPHAGPMPFGGPRPVMSIDGNVMLLNCPKMRERGLQTIPDFGGFHGYDLVLSFETLRHGMCVLTDPRLYAKHDSGGNAEGFSEFTKTAPFVNYLSEHYMEHQFDTINGPIALDRRDTFPWLLADTAASSMQVRLLDCFDSALASARRDKPPKLAICVRSQLNRPALLERFMMSAASATREAEALIDIEIVVMTDQAGDRAEEVAETYRQRFGSLKLRCVSHNIAAGRASRVDLAIAAFRLLDADFIWFVDDDDYLLPSGAIEVARSLCANVRQLLVIDCLRVREEWTSRDGAEVLTKSATIGHTSSSAIYDAFNGDNHVPFCGLIFPRALMKEKLELVKGRTAYYEDFFLLLVALSAPDLCVEELARLCCGISVRGADNTVTEEDRTVWNISLATVLGEILATPGLATTVSWAAFRRTRIVQSTSVQITIPPDDLGIISEDGLHFSKPGDRTLPAHSTLCGNVETVDLDGEELVVKGWAVDTASKTPVEQIALVLGNRILCLAPVHSERLDVANALKIPTAVNCGFYLRIKSPSGWRLERDLGIYAVGPRSAMNLPLHNAYSRRLTEVLRASRNAVEFSTGLLDVSYDCGTDQFGQHQGTLDPQSLAQERFDEEFYLESHSDVRKAVEEGRVASGFHHWLSFGFREGRETRVRGK